MVCCLPGKSHRDWDREKCAHHSGTYTDHDNVKCNDDCFMRTILMHALTSQIGYLGNSLQTEYDFRDEVLKPSKKGREYISLYYEHAPKVVEIAGYNPRLVGQALEVLWDLLPLFKNVISSNIDPDFQPNDSYYFEERQYIMLASFFDELKAVIGDEDGDLCVTLDKVKSELKQLVGTDSRELITKFNQ